MIPTFVAAISARQHMAESGEKERNASCDPFVSALEAGKRRVDLIEFLLIVRTLGADPLAIFAEIVGSVAG
jgi:hypothetical protein